MYCQERKIEKLLAVVLAVFVLAIVGIGYVLAANNGNSFGYAWSEGFGWIRLDGTASLQTYGVTVPNGEGSFLTGYAWGEDAGWIHFSGSCDTAGGCPQGFGNTYGVVASRASCSVGAVCLSGYAWGEGVGWIRFAATSSTYANNGATTYGVYIDANGQFQGYAWGEDAGWIHFSGSCDEAGGCPGGGNTYSVSGATSTGSFSMGLWVRPTVSIASKALVVKNNEIRLVTDSSGKPMCQINNGTVWQTATTSTTALALNEWSYVSCVYDRSNIKIYIDGVLQKTQTMSNVDIQNTYNPLKIGKDDSGTYGDFQGYIDDFKVYNYARSAGQVKADFTGKATPKGAVARSVTVGEQTNASEGLVGYWKMDEASWAGVANEVVDSSGNANHGVAAGGATKANTTSTAKFGMAGNFDGVDDYVSVGTGTTLNPTNNAITVEAWINKKGTFGGYGAGGLTGIGNGWIVGKGSGYSEGWRLTIADETVSSPRSIRFQIGAGGGALTAYSAGIISDNTWYHIVAVWNGTITTIYINGVVSGTPRAVASSYVTTALGAYLGFNSNGVGYFNGQIDDVKIYNKARTADQVRRDYESGPPPVARWKMDENAGQYAYDTSGNSNTGTLGTATTTDSADPQWAQGKYGSALKFDGSNDYVGVAGTVSSVAKTLSFWVKPNSTTQKLIELSASDYIYLSGGVVTVAGFGTPTVYVDGVQTTTFANTNWHYISVVSSASLTANGVNLGKNNSTYYSGFLDDVRIYNYARTQKQIMEDMLGTPKLISEGGTGSYVAYWPMDEGAGDTAYDKSVNHNNGDLAGACPGAATCPTWTPNGKFGKALSFDGGDYVQAVDSASLDPTIITISAWVNPNLPASGAYHPIVSKANTGTNQGYWLNYDARPTPKIRFIVGNASTNKDYNLTYTLPNNIWSHLVATYDGSYLRIYVNGILVGTSSVFTDGMVVPTNKTLRIGADDNPNGYFTGSIDEVKIYPFALSPAEVKEEFNRGSSLKLGSVGGRADLPTSTDSGALEYCIPGDTANCAAPVARWKMDEKTGQYAYDTSGNGNTGTLGTGATADASDPTWKSSASCHSGSCLKFDGTDDYVNMGNVASYNLASTNHTLSAWFKAPTKPSEDYANILFRYTGGASPAGYFLSMRSATGRLYFGEQADGGNTLDISPTTNYADNKWHFVSAVVDVSAKTGYLYVDGVFILSDTYTGNLVNYNANLGLGGDTTYTNWQGFLDDIRIYNYARTAAQVAYDYNRGAPVAWWKMNDGQNNSTTCDATTSVVRDSGYNCLNGGTCNTGTLNLSGSPATSTAWSEGKYGCGLTLDGSNDYVSVADNDNLSFGNSSKDKPFSVSAWVKMSDATSFHIVSKGVYNTDAEYIFDIDSTDRFLLRLYDESVASCIIGQRYINPLTSLQNTWVHLTGTYDGSSLASGIKLYLNGKLLTTDAYSNNGGSYIAMENLTHDVWIGNYAGVTANGIIDDVQIYNYALTATQVKTLYNQNSAVRFGPTEGLP